MFYHVMLPYIKLYFDIIKAVFSIPYVTKQTTYRKDGGMN